MQMSVHKDELWWCEHKLPCEPWNTGRHPMGKSSSGSGFWDSIDVTTVWLTWVLSVQGVKCTLRLMQATDVQFQSSVVLWNCESFSHVNMPTENLHKQHDVIESQHQDSYGDESKHTS